jgi:hypothetical protein
MHITFITAQRCIMRTWKKYYPKLSNDVNINCLQKPIGNQELVKIVNMTMGYNRPLKVSSFISDIMLT